MFKNTEKNVMKDIVNNSKRGFGIAFLKYASTELLANFLLFLSKIETALFLKPVIS